MALNPSRAAHTQQTPYSEIQNATDLFHHHQSAAAKAKTQIIQMLDGLTYNVIFGWSKQNQTQIIQILGSDL